MLIQILKKMLYAATGKRVITVGNEFTSCIGRFITEDTVAGEIEYVQSLNRYAFAGNNPVNYLMQQETIIGVMQ